MTVPAATAVHAVVPHWIDDPARPSGGNTYDRRICAGLTVCGWDVRIHPAAGPWPRPQAADLAALGDLLDQIDDGAVVVVDGLIGCAADSVLLPRADRLRFVLLVHLPLGLGTTDVDASTVAISERSVLASASAVITTSDWTRGWLLDRYGLDPAVVHTARPGVDAAEVTLPSAGGGRLLCVAAVTPIKGHDVLLGALAELGELPWQLTCVGSLDVDPGFAAEVRGRWGSALENRVRWVGPLSGPELAAAYTAADLLLVPSRVETYGMVATEALARGVPVIASAVGGLLEAVGAHADTTIPNGTIPNGTVPNGTVPDGTVPNNTVPDGGAPVLLAPSGDEVALRGALRRWLTEPLLRARLRRSALDRAPHLRSWGQAAAEVSGVLTGMLTRTGCAAGNVGIGVGAVGGSGASPGIGQWAP